MIDVAAIHVKAGDGGNGLVSFHRAKYLPKGGQDGGDGGHGGSVYLVGDKDMNTLQSFMGKRKYHAEDGGHGGSERMHGANGDDIEIKIPVGTVVSTVHDDGTVTQVTDIIKHGEKFKIAKGGKGGLGNDHFKSATNQTPMYAEFGTRVQGYDLRLELKLLANVGLVGFPNAGKSSLLAALTKARPEIANYPFTTTSPNLGVVIADDGVRTLVVADIPGLIEGAGTGKGLGHEFLRHIERCGVLLFVLCIDDAVLFDNDRTDAEKAKSLGDGFEVLKKELESYHPDLLKKPLLVGINKTDLYSDDLKKEIKKRFTDALFFSAITRDGLDVLKKKLFS
ncbi:MAG TPA: GTPase ObgE [Patescibacteria group bacterium]|nr:GTPase ObgE [Patescibacteria group bacterium]